MLEERTGRVLVVDDDDVNCLILKKILEKQYELAFAHNGKQCLEMVPTFRPDVVLLDIMMPQMDGYEACRHIKESPVGDVTQVILVSCKASASARLLGFEAQADDYVIEPFDHDELRWRIRVQFRLREANYKLWALNEQLQLHNTHLGQLVAERTAEIVATRDLTVFALAKLADSRDPETGEHLSRIRTYSHLLAEQLRRDSPYAAQIDEPFMENLFRASPLHDIGKVGLPDSILLKPGRLTPGEFEAMKQHVIIGAETLEEAAQQGSGGGFLAMAAEVARYHHERFDGSGYCAGLLGTDIPLSARIVALADVYDALSSRRVYKPAFLPEKCREIIDQETGRHFDPVVVEAFLTCYDRFLAVAEDAELVGTADAVTETALSIGA